MTKYLQQVKGYRGSFVLFLAKRDGRANRASGQRKMLEREDHPQSGKWREILSSDGEEGLGQKAGHLFRQPRRTGAMDAAKSV